MDRKHIFQYMIFLLIIIFCFSIFSQAQEEPIEHVKEEVTEVYDEDDNYIFSTARQVTENDRYLSEENVEYVVRKVEDNKAVAEKEGKVDLVNELEADTSLPLLARDSNKSIALYHTHNGESYTPGPENVDGEGEIHDIGKTLAQRLEENGINASHSEEMHLPHDGAAYSRSRRTAVNLTQDNPDAIFDIHRDAIPDPQEYIKEIDGRKITQIRLVLGRQNPNQNVNEQFARNLKAISDKYTPGLIRDIFYGRGEYNQSIHPRALLMEFGTYDNNEDMVKNSTSLMAESIGRYIYGGDPGETAGSEAEGRSAWFTLSWILALLTVGILTYLYINEGSWQGVMDKIRKFFREEIIDR